MKIDEIRKVTKEITEQLTDQGKIIEGGWISYRTVVIPPMASDTQLI